MAYVYLLGDSGKDGSFKIGVTRGSIEKRIKKLQTGNDSDIYLVAYYETNNAFYVEKMMHLKYCSKQIMNEWYKLDTNDVGSFQKTCGEIEERAMALKDNPFFKKKFNYVET